MKTSLEKLDGLKRALAVDLSIDIFRQKTDQILRNAAMLMLGSLLMGCLYLLGHGRQYRL
jgi:hypothetical protein